MPMPSTLRRMTVVVLCMAPAPIARGQTTHLASVAEVARGDLLDRPARLHVENVPLATALAQLMERSGIAIAYSPSRLPGEMRVTCRCDSLSVGDALAVLLADTDLAVREENGRVMLVPESFPRALKMGMRRPAPDDNGASSALRFSLAPIELPAKPRDEPASEPPGRGAIAGVVVDSATNEPVPGARVYVLEVERGESADDDGRFVVRDIPAGEVHLRVALLGYRPLLTSARSGSGDLRIVLERAAVGLEGVVVTASGTQRVREIGSEIARVRADSVTETSPAANLAELLNARAPGVYVKSASGSSSGGARIRIRGSSSPSLPNEPLVYVDGVRINTEPQSLSFMNNQQMPSRFNDINPDEIESIDVLKGPSASTMYGTQAANGVILITTKSGAGAQRRAEWRTWAEAGRITEPNEYPANYRGIGAAGETCLLSSVAVGSCTQADVLRFNLIEDPRTTPFTAGRRGVLGVSLAGRSGEMNYFFFGEREDERGVYPRDGIEKTNVRANFGVRPVEPMDIQVSAGYVSSTLSLFADGGTGIGIVTNGLAGGACATCWFQFSPEQLARIDATQDVERFIGSSTVSLRAAHWLQFRGTVGLDAVNRVDSRLFPVGALTGARASGERNTGRNTAHRRTADLLARADLPITEALLSRTSAGIQYLADRSATVSATGTHLVPGTNSLGAAGVVTTSEFSSSVRSIGAYVEQQLGLHDRVFATVGLRTDRNSSFGRDTKTVVYPKIGVSWVVSEESFFPDLSFVTSLRLRGAKGQSGSQPGPLNAITYFGSFPVVTPDGTNQVGVSFENGNLGNPALKPERSTELELGLDAALLQGRLDVGLTYYDKSTRDALVLRQVAPSVGTSMGRWENLSQVKNTGWEVSFVAQVLERSDVSASLAGSATHNSNRLARLGNGVAPITFGAHQRHVEGYPLGGYWMRALTGFADANGDGIIAPSEVQVTDTAAYLGEVTPPLMASLQPSVQLFERLKFGALVSFSYGNKLYNYTEGFRCNGGGARARSDITTPLAEQAKCVAHALRGVPGAFVEDAGFTKLREVSVTYALPRVWTSAARVSSATLTLAGQNLGTWTNYPGIDPDISSRGTNFEVVDFLQPGSRRMWLVRASLAF